MRRRLFLQSGSAAAVAYSLTACGGGGGSSSDSIGATSFNGGGVSTPSTNPPLSAPYVSSANAGYPFASRLRPYAAGIKPSKTNDQMDTLLAAQYDAWKAARVVDASSIVAGGKAILFSNPSYVTVSEGMGYGMLLAAVFGGHDPQAQALFDGLLAVVRARPAYAVVPFDPNGKYLMEWRINADGTSGGEGWNAMDGDLDIAMALLMADHQWGSTGTWNYVQEARNTIAALKSWNMNESGATKGLPNGQNNRTSDYMVGHFRAFKVATGDTIWDRAVDKAYKLLDHMQTQYSPGVGLMPDFVMATDSADPHPSTGYIGDGNANEGYYWWNACRNPWRYSADYVLSGDARFATVTGRMIDFFKSSSGGDPANIGMGYALDGTMLAGGNKPGGNSAAFIAPICAGACVDARFQGFVDALWDWNVGRLTTGYYDSEIQLLSMVVASGNWWTPQ